MHWCYFKSIMIFFFSFFNFTHVWRPWVINGSTAYERWQPCGLSLSCKYSCGEKSTDSRRSNICCQMIGFHFTVSSWNVSHNTKCHLLTSICATWAEVGTVWLHVYSLILWPTTASLVLMLQFNLGWGKVVQQDRKRSGKGLRLLLLYHC